MYLDHEYLNVRYNLVGDNHLNRDRRPNVFMLTVPLARTWSDIPAMCHRNKTRDRDYENAARTGQCGRQGGQGPTRSSAFINFSIKETYLIMKWAGR